MIVIRTFHLQKIFFVVLTTLFINWDVLGQNDYWDAVAEIELLVYDDDLTEAMSKAQILTEAYPDSLHPFLSFVNLLMYNEVDEDIVYDWIDIGDEKFEGNYDWMALQMGIFAYWGEYADVVYFVDSMHKEKYTTRSYSLLSSALFELDDTLRSENLRKELLSHYEEDYEYAKTLVESYANWGILDSAQYYLDKIFETGHTDMELYKISAFIKLKLKDKVSACMDLQIARKKGYQMNDKWAIGLNCFNEDRTDPMITNFLTKHQDCTENGDSLNIAVNRKYFRPNGFKKVRINYKQDDKTTSEIYEIVNYGSKNYSYFEENEGPRFPELMSIPFCDFSENLSLNSGNDTIAFSEKKQYPLEFKKCHSIWVHTGFERYEEVRFVGYENKSLSNGTTLSCAKFKLSKYYFDQLTYVAYYWFSNGNGWIAKEDSMNEQIEIIPIKY